MIIDTHCHIDMYPEPIDIVNKSEQLGIITIGMTNLPSHFKMGFLHLKGYKKVKLALGMHPLLANSHPKEFPLFYQNLDKTSFIGEVGLDFSKEGLLSKKEQLISFKKILIAVNNSKKILSIHSRNAEKEVLTLLKEYGIKNAIFHWYTGGMKTIDEISDNNYYFSINPAMINSENGRKIIKRIPNELLLTESDGPYVQVNNNIVEPMDIGLVIKFLSEKHKAEPASIEKMIQNNFNKLINRISLDF